jgi:hypothetical protein
MKHAFGRREGTRRPIACKRKAAAWVVAAIRPIG